MTTRDLGAADTAATEAQQAAASARDAAELAQEAAADAEDHEEGASQRADKASESADDATESADDAAESADEAAQSAERAAEHAAAAHAAVEKGSLFDAVDPEATRTSHYGELGPPVSRTAALYRGFLGAVGVLLAVVLGFAVREVVSVLVLIMVSAFLAIGLNPIVELGIRRGLKRSWSVLIVTVVFLAVLAVVVFELVGVLRTQISSFLDHAPHLLETLKRHKSLASIDKKYHVITNLENKLQDPNLAADTFRGIFNTGLGLLRAAGNTLVVFVLTTYFLAALPQAKRALYSLAPASRRQRVVSLGDEILRRVGRYVIGAFLVALLAGTVTAIFLTAVGLGQYALPLALLVALLDLVPLVGSVTGAAIVCIVCLATSLDIGIAAIVFYLIYEPIEGYVIYPRVMRSTIDVPEYVTVLAVLFGGALGGVVGALLALPIAAALLLLVQEVWVRRQNLR